MSYNQASIDAHVAALRMALQTLKAVDLPPDVRLQAANDASDSLDRMLELMANTAHNPKQEITMCSKCEHENNATVCHACLFNDLEISSPDRILFQAKK